MTAWCGGGASQAKPGVRDAIVIGGTALATLLGNSGTPWGITAAGVIGAITLNASELCDSDPPPEPDIDAGDWIALYNVDNLAAHIIAVQKFRDLVVRAVWWATCECAAGGTPPQPIVPAPPGTPTFPGAAAAPCFMNTISAVAVNSIYGDDDPCAITEILGPHGAHVSQVRGTNTLTAITLPIPLPTSLTLTLQTSATSTPEGSDLTIEFYDVANAQISTLGLGPESIAGYPYTLHAAIPSNAHHWVIGWANTGGVAVNSATISLSLYCGGNGPGGIATPCITDPATQATLEEILRYVKLIQRQKVPFAYVPGTRHNGLTGSGQFTVQGLVGVSIILTTIPNWLGNIAGDPPEIFDAGFATIGTADGWHRSVRLEHNPTLILPIEGSETRIGYTLEVGVVADILELVREP